MIYITGDTHIPINISKLNTKNFPEQKQMTKNDFIIICGDFGGVWDGGNEELYWRKWLNKKNFTVLFVDGNHENHLMLNEYDIENYCDGRVHRIEEYIYHLMRGEVYTIAGVKIFTMGGAVSRDKIYRKEGKSWWMEEMPSEKEYQNAVRNLDKHEWNVDYIISHCCPDSIQSKIADYYEHDKLTNFFEHVVKADCSYKKWFFGHYHDDKEIDDKHICLYNRIMRL